MLVPNGMVRGGSITLERTGEKGQGTRVCSCLCLGPPEAEPETRACWQVLCLKDKPRKRGCRGEARETGEEKLI